MALFRKKPVPAPAGAAPPGGPTVLRARRDPRALAFEAQLARGQWQELHDFLEATTEWDLRYFYVTELARISGRPQWLDEWVAERPGSALPLLFRGSHSKYVAWQARFAAGAGTMQEDALLLFHGRLVVADRDLAAAAALDERDPNPWAESVAVAGGLSLGQPELRRRFEEAHRRDPFNGAASVNMRCESNEATLQFARWVSGEAPDGHTVHKVVALAHIELWLASPSGEAQQAYFRSQAVKQEVLAAARRSILSPDYRRSGSVLSWQDRNVFAFCFRLMGEYGAQLEQMRLIGPHVLEFPWVYLGEPARKYEEQRQMAFRQLYGVAGPPWEAFLASAGWDPAPPAPAGAGG